MTNNYKTFQIKPTQGILTVTFNYPPVNIQGVAMINDLNELASQLEENTTIKVVIFESVVKDFFIAHADINMLQNLSTAPVPRDQVKLGDLALVLDRISKLPQATIAKIEGYARGGGNEFALACDMRFGAIGKAIFMQMEVGMGILPSGGGCARLTRQMGLGKALEFVLSAKDYNAKEAQKIGLINKAIEPDKIGLYVYELAQRISQFPAQAITSCKRALHSSTDLPVEQALLEETYQLYQATSQTPAVQRFTNLAKKDFQDSIPNQKSFQTLLMGLQD